MTTVQLSPDIVEALQQEAEQAGTTLDNIVNDWLRKQRRMLRQQRLQEQTKLFWEHYQDLYEKHPEAYVAFYNGEVLDHDLDLRQLTLRVREKHGSLPAVIAQVTKNPVREHRTISTHQMPPAKSI